MGVDTKLKLKGCISVEDIANCIEGNLGVKTYIRKNKSNIYERASYMVEFYGENPITETAYIAFEYKGEGRNLFYHYSNFNTYENLEYYSDLGLEDMVKSETTSLILGCHGYSVEIMKEIAKCFGGWLDESDCDSEPYYEIEKSTGKLIRPTRVVTMNEIYEMFGEKVVIKK